MASCHGQTLGKLYILSQEKKNVGSLEIHDNFPAEQAICPHEKKKLRI